MFRTLVVFVVSFMLFSCTQSFENGENAFADESGDSISIMIDADSGISNIQQLLDTGASQYARQCASCHGPSGAGAPGTSILSAIRADRAISHTWQAMPPASPSSCDQSCSTAVIAWVAEQNGIELDIQLEQPDGGTTTNPESSSLEPLAQTYHRATVLFKGEFPSASEMADMETASEAEIRSAIRANMTGEGFRHFIKDGANDRLLTRGIKQSAHFIVAKGLQGSYPNNQIGTELGLFDKHKLANELSEAPLELVYHIVKNEKPYSEVLTADYLMVSQHTAFLYETGLSPAADEWMVAQDNGQRVHNISGGKAGSDWENSHLADKPNAGVITTFGFMARYPTTNTNRNRTRANQIMMQFLGYDIEASAPRLKLSDTENFANPTMENEVCSSCHNIMDPIASTFQNFETKGMYVDNPLPKSYRGSDLYQEGDTWYRDMLEPGYYGTLAPEGSNTQGQTNSVVWLAHQIVNDERFATGAVKFWWPTVFGREYTENDFALIEDLADDFRVHMNLKDLLVDMVMTSTYRRGSLNAPAAPVVATPELMEDKYHSLGVSRSSFGSKHLIFFGGIDSLVSTKRERDINAVSLNVLKSNAYKHSCLMTYQDFELPAAERNLFTNIELDVVAGSLLRFQTGLSSAKEIVTTVKTVDVQGQGNITLFVRGASGNDAYLTAVTVTTQDGTVVFNGPATDLPAAGGALVHRGDNAGTKLGFKKEAHNALLTLPPLLQGTTSLEITIEHRSYALDVNDASIWVDVLGDDSSASFASERIRYQLVDLAYSLWGEKYDAQSVEIEALYNLFSGLLQNAQVRGQTNTQYGSNICEGLGAVSGYDTDYTFHAWKGVIAAMLSDFSFFLN